VVGGDLASGTEEKVPGGTQQGGKKGGDVQVHWEGRTNGRVGPGGSWGQGSGDPGKRGRGKTWKKKKKGGTNPLEHGSAEFKGGKNWGLFVKQDKNGRAR